LGRLQSRTYSAQVAADLCAETFAVALEQFDRFDPDRGDPGAWLWGIARNLLLRYQRAEAVDLRARQRLAISTPSVVDDDLDLIEREIDRDLLTALVERALSQLSDPVARAVRHRVLDELPYDEVARLADCSEAAARVRVSRGLSTLLESRAVETLGRVSR
jgi:RNA polymerase sigma-70 factor (ECF subfamily)